MAIIMKHINDKFEPPRRYNPKISKPCSKLIEIMMAKKKGERQQSWASLIKDIELVLEGKNPHTSLPVGGSTVQRETAVGKSEDLNQSPVPGKSAEDAVIKKKSSNKKIIAMVAAVFLAAIIPIAIITVAVILFFQFKTKKPQDSGRRSVSSRKQILSSQPVENVKKVPVEKTDTPSTPEPKTSLKNILNDCTD